MRYPDTTSASLLRIAGSMARLGGWAIDLDTDEVYWSDELNRILDYPVGQVPDLDEAIGLYPEPYRSQVLAALEACRTDGTPFDLTLETETRTGRRIWVRAVGEAAQDDDGRVVRLQGAFQDVDDRVRAEREVERLAARLTDTFESITDALFTLDTDWRFVYLNQKAEDLLERRREDLVGRNVWDEFAPAVGGPSYHAYHEAVATGERQTATEYYEPLDRTFEVDAFPSDHGLTVYFRDVTDEVRLRARLEERQQLLDRARDAIFILDAGHRFTYWNGGAERLYGWSAEEAHGRSARDLLFADPDEFDRASERLVAAGEWSGEVIQRNRTGDEIVVESSWTLLPDESDAPASVLVINTDVSERKRIEQQFLRAQRLESIGTLAGGIAHDLNNVLAPILMAVQLLAADESDPERREILATIEQSTQRGADMVRQVLTFARGVDATGDGLAVTDLLADVERLVGETFPRNIELRVVDSTDHVHLPGDSTQLHQVLLNLCVNARDAMLDGGTLTVVADEIDVDEHFAAQVPDATPGRHLVLQVEDTGTGMPGDVVDRVFEPFFTTKDVGSGTGLGLPTSMAIVRSHGGFLQVYSEVGRGSTFKVYLPISGHAVRPAEVAAPEQVRGEGQLVLVVDDEASVLQVTRRTLEAFGYRVLTAADGAQAVSIFTAHPDIEVVLTDMMMPVMDGLATIRALRSIRPDIPIVAASGLTANGAMAGAADAGATSFLAKPYTAAAMLELLASVLRRT